MFLLLFADDIVLLSSTPSGLQNQIDSLEKVSQSLGLTVNLDKTKMMVFRARLHNTSIEPTFQLNAEFRAKVVYGSCLLSGLAELHT